MSSITEGMASAESYSRKTPVHQPTNCPVTRTHAKGDALVPGEMVHGGLVVSTRLQSESRMSCHAHAREG
jgi:hypothetical protein